MDKRMVLVKTAKGVEEMRSRTHGLPQKLRALLIMVDGTATVGDILVRFPGIPEIEANLERLAAQGFVEARAGAAAPAAAAPPPAPPPGVALPGTAEEALRMLGRMLYDTIGPVADLITGEIERARDAATYSKAVERGARMLEGQPASRAKAFRDLAEAIRARFFPG